MRALSLLLFAFVVQTGTAVAQTWSPEQQEIWRLEDQQWKMNAAKDLTWIETMVHANVSWWAVALSWAGEQGFTVAMGQVQHG